MIKSDLLLNEEKALSIKAKKFYYLCITDYFNTIKEYEKMILIAKKGIIYAKKAYQANERNFENLVTMYETLAYTLFRVKKYNESLDVLELIENEKPPKNYNNHIYIDLLLKNIRINLYGKLKHKKFEILSQEILSIVPKLDIRTSINFYYAIIAFNTTTFCNYKKTTSVFKKFMTFFLKNHKEINGSLSIVFQIFLKFFISAFKLHNKETFVYVCDDLFFRKNEILFNQESKFSYVSSLFNLLNGAYDIGIYNEVFLIAYFDIWSKSKGLVIRKKELLIESFPDNYNEKMINKIISNLNFE